ncbi:MAG: DUF4191 domain-containing protein [Micromonosporaceae bacterium]
MAAQPDKVSFRDRLKQIGMAFRFTAKHDRVFIPLVIVAVAVPLGLAVWWVLAGGDWVWSPIGVLLALLGAMVMLNWRANKAMMAQAEGQPGAAAAILDTMRGDWRVTPAVQATTQQDYVHRVLGRPGVILVAEGSGRVRGLLGQEKKRLSRVVGETPIYDFIIGDGDDQVPIRKLRKTLSRLRWTTLREKTGITPKQVNALDTRLKALGARPQMPKGPIPKNMRPKGMNRAMRGR